MSDAEVAIPSDMSDTTLTSAVIEEQALKAISITTDGQQVTRRSIAEIVQARQAAGSAIASQKKGLGLFFQKIKPGGAG